MAKSTARVPGNAAVSPPCPDPSRRRLRSMKVSSTFRTFALEQLRGLKDVRARPMFGGIGLYSDGKFFGLIAADTLYLKVDDSNRYAYERAGCCAYQPFADRPMTMPYYNVPVSILTNATLLAVWARKSVVVASAAKK